MISSGLVMYKMVKKEPQFLLAHPGGPLWKGKDKNAWSIPKGLVENGEDLWEAGVREFKEEIGTEPKPPFIPLGSITQKSGKVVHAWGFEGQFSGKPKSNTFDLEWPPGSGKIQKFPEIDDAKFFTIDDAKEKLNAKQFPLIQKLYDVITGSDKPWLTALSRGKISTPTRWLKENNLLKGRVLDYGCGRGKDAKVLGFDKYDLFWWPKRPTGKYDTIICNYVLNVVTEDVEKEILKDVKSLLKPDGKAYFSVRRDCRTGQTSKKTYQRIVDMDLPIIKKSSRQFVIYVMEMNTMNNVRSHRQLKKRTNPKGLMDDTHEVALNITPEWIAKNTKIKKKKTREDISEIISVMEEEPERSNHPEDPISVPIDVYDRFYDPEIDQWDNPLEMVQSNSFKAAPFCKKWFIGKLTVSARLHRHCAYNRLSDDGEFGYRFTISNPDLDTITPKLSNHKIIYEGKGELQISSSEWTPIPVISPNSEFLGYSTSDGEDLEIAKDVLGNYYVRGNSGKFIKMSYTLGEDGKYHYLKKMDRKITLNDVKTFCDSEAVDSNLKSIMRPHVDGLNIDTSKPLYEILKQMEETFASCTCCLTDGSKESLMALMMTGIPSDILIDCFEFQRGAGRARAMAFYVTANIIGIPCRYCVSDCHCFVEVYDGKNWWAIDLGDCLPKGAQMFRDAGVGLDFPKYGTKDQGYTPSEPESPGEYPTSLDDRGLTLDQCKEELKRRFAKSAKKNYKFSEEDLEKAYRAIDQSDIYEELI